MMQTIQKAIRQLHGSLRDYIEATYHISAPSLIKQRKELLNRPGVIHQVPYLESTPRYETGETFAAMDGLPPAALEVYSKLTKPDGELPRLLYDPPYKHQSEAVRHSLINGKNLVIMTGTGSDGEETYLFIPTDFPDPFGDIPPPCYVTQVVGTDQINILSTGLINNNPYVIPSIFSRALDKSFLNKHIFSLYQQAISRGYFEYLNDLKILTGNIGSLFDSPPGQVKGNIISTGNPEEQVLGYFAAVLGDTIRMAIFPNDLDFFVSDNCKFIPDPRTTYKAQCLDCSIIPRSTQVRPDFFSKVN